jgi:HPt (histidine-containing phosphotransfer) domain-containing protein
MYCGNKANYISILKSHRESADETIEQMEGFYANEDWKNYTIAVHGIKSSMMSIGAVQLSELAKALELAGKGGDFDYIRREHGNMITEFRRVQGIMDNSSVLGVREHAQEISAKPQITDECFNQILVDMENATYEFDGSKLKELLDKLSAYSLGGKDLHTELAQVYKKIDMSDYMSAYDTVVKIKDRLTKA